MAHYADLSTRCMVDEGQHIRAIGWLDAAHPFPTGAVEKDFVECLTHHVATAWRPVASGGVHFCNLCLEENRRAGGAQNIWIPSRDKVYVAPDLIVHYVETHRYLPPDEFIQAVMACPAQGSEDYFSLLKRFPNWYEINALQE